MLTLHTCIAFKRQRQGKSTAAQAPKPLPFVVGNRAVSPSSTWSREQSRGEEGLELRAAQNLLSTFRRTQTSAGKFISSLSKPCVSSFPHPAQGCAACRSKEVVK